MNNFKLIVLLFSFFAMPVYAQNSQNDKYEKCESAQGSINGAMAADDWISVEKFAKKAIAYCKDAGDPSYSLASEYGTLVEAQYMLKHYHDAVSNASTCIDFYYNAPSCHYYKVLAFRHLNKKADADRETDIALKVFDIVLNEDETDSNRVSHYINVLKIQKQYAEIYKNKLMN